jgi:16S rRNA (cytosine967-C5)-methyltransferase
LAEDWLSRFGLERAFECGLASIRRPSVYLQPNLTLTDPQTLLEYLAAAGIEAELHGHGPIRIASPGRIDLLPGYQEGHFYVQDPAAASVVELLEIRPGQSVLDLCAAPGGKVLQVYLANKGQCRVVATDADQQRLEILMANLRRLRLQSVSVIPYAEIGQYVDKHGRFDVVLVDAPCSNTGVLARRVEVRFRLSQQDLSWHASRQVQLLEKTASVLAPGGVILYSTCSIQQQENEDVVMAFTKDRPGLVVDSQRLTLPCPGPLDHDGGYAAVIRSKG